jgi:serine/threonine protein kinase
VQYSVVQYRISKRVSARQHSVEQSLLKNSTPQYNTIQYNTIQYNTIQYDTLQLSLLPPTYQLLGVVKLADFGFAKTLEQGASLAESFCGTLDFIAPERITGCYSTFMCMFVCERECVYV